MEDERTGGALKNDFIFFLKNFEFEKKMWDGVTCYVQYYSVSPPKKLYIDTRIF